MRLHVYIRVFTCIIHNGDRQASDSWVATALISREYTKPVYIPVRLMQSTSQDSIPHSLIPIHNAPQRINTYQVLEFVLQSLCNCTA